MVLVKIEYSTDFDFLKSRNPWNIQFPDINTTTGMVSRTVREYIICHRKGRKPPTD